MSARDPERYSANKPLILISWRLFSSRGQGRVLADKELSYLGEEKVELPQGSTVREQDGAAPGSTVGERMKTDRGRGGERSGACSPTQRGRCAVLPALSLPLSVDSVVVLTVVPSDAPDLDERIQPPLLIGLLLLGDTGRSETRPRARQRVQIPATVRASPRQSR